MIEREALIRATVPSDLKYGAVRGVGALGPVARDEEQKLPYMDRGRSGLGAVPRRPCRRHCSRSADVFGPTGDLCDLLGDVFVDCLAWASLKFWMTPADWLLVRTSANRPLPCSSAMLMKGFRPSGPV